MVRPSKSTATATTYRGAFATGGPRGEQGMQAGQTIAGKYRLNRVLGTGGMATVWSATNIFTDRDFAVKVMLPQVARTPEAARRFMLEARVSARINHPCIIEIIDVGQGEDGSPFLVMELLTGTSLDVAVRRSPGMLVHEFLSYMRDVAEALAAAHRCGVIHRDLKPTNIFLHKDRDGRMGPKVLDFGVSKVLEEGNDALTVVGTILGSPLYMSPEQAMGADGIDGRTDVFAFGAIFFEALCGQRAYDAANLNALIVAIATTAPKSIDELAPNLPESLRSLVRDCLIVDKTKRIGSFDTVVARLDAMLLELATSELRLPAQLRAEGAGEASGDVPRKRTSERPPPTASGMGLRADFGSGTSPPISIQAGTSRASAATTSSSPAWLHAHRSSVGPGAAGWPMAWIAAGALVMVGVGVAAAFVRNGSSGPTTHALALHPVAPSPPASVAASAAETQGDVPIIPVDSLPIATRTRSDGHLSVGSAPGPCNVYVDGVARGPAPVSNVTLSPGIHRVDCTPPGGRVKTAHVNVPEGAAAHYEFAIPND
jgi:serine/threonine-protein kinase